MPLRPKMELRDYGALFLRRKWMIVFSFLFILLCASVYCVVTPELYKSSTTILIIPQSVPQDYVRSTVSVKVEQQLATIKQQVLSRTTLMKVMEELRLFERERKHLSPEEVVELMRKRVEIEVAQGRSRDSSDAWKWARAPAGSPELPRTVASCWWAIQEVGLRARSAVQRDVMSR